MAQFPKSEPLIAALAHKMVGGFSTNAATYPAVPVPHLALSGLINAYTQARNAAVAKDAALEALTDAMEKDLRYAEMVTGGNDAKLSLIGWGGKSAAVALQPPGQCRTLEAPQQGEGWLFLDWKEPLDGGKVAAYKIQRRERPAGGFSDVATAIESEITLNSQQRGKEFEFRVIAINKAGEGEASNTVLAVL